MLLSVRCMQRLQNAGIIPVLNLSGVDACELILICIVPEKCVLVKLAFSRNWQCNKKGCKTQLLEEPLST